MDIAPSQTIYVNNIYEKVSQETLRKSLHAMFSQFGPILDVVTGKTLKKRGQAFVVFSNVTHATNALRSMQGFPFFEKPIRIQFAKSKSDAVAKLDGTYKQVHPGARNKASIAERVSRPREKRPKTEEAPQEKRQKTAAKQQSQGQKQAPAQQSLPNKILFVQNLPENTNEMMLSMLFKQFPGDATLRPRTRHTSRSAGFVEVRMIESRPGIAFVEFENEHLSAVAIQGLQGFKIGPENFMNITYANR